MNLFVLFGLPGTGKSYVGKILQTKFGFYHHDGDEDMPDSLRDAILNNGNISDTLRDDFFQRLIRSARDLSGGYQNLVVSQTFVKEKYREQFLKELPQAKFILIKTADEIREKRLPGKTDWQLDMEVWQRMAAIFEPPKIPHTIIYNDKDGEEELVKQLQLLIK